jgi:uncharacterized protein (TIGR03118 family)
MQLKKGQLLWVLLAGAWAASGVVRADGDDRAYQQTNLVSDGVVSAATPDAHLKNPWGMAATPGGAFWLADNHTGVATLYNGLGSIVPLVVTVPPPAAAPADTLATPTGIVFNPNSAQFQVAPKLGAVFIFATEDGTISAWNPSVDPTHALLEADNSQSGAVYKGLAVATNSTGMFLYATNFRAGTVDVFDSKFQPAKLAGSFVDPHLPPGYAPFGIALVDGNLLVTYALQDADKEDDQKGPGHGFVDVFDTDGHLITRFASRGTLNSPWGVARAPLNFGPFSGDILIGNQGDGHISAFGSHGEFHGLLRTASGAPVAIDGLWSLGFGDEAAADPAKLYFTAGTNAEADGLFGSLEVVGR